MLRLSAKSESLRFPIPALIIAEAVTTHLRKTLNELINIWELLRTGYVENEKRSPLQVLLFTGRILLILLLFKTISIGLIFFLNWLEVFKIPENLNITRLESFSEFEILLLTSIYAPILEELTFRLPLKFSKLNLTIASIGISIVFCRVLVELNYEYSLILSSGIGIVTYVRLNERALKKLAELFSKNRLLFFYSSLLIFSFIHLRNYELTAELLIFSPIFILPKILGGILYSYVRLNSGIIIAILFHSFNNGILRVIKIITE